MAITSYQIDLDWTRNNITGTPTIPLVLPPTPNPVTEVQARLRKAIFYGEDINMELHRRNLYPPQDWVPDNLQHKLTFIVLPFPNWDRVFKVNGALAYRRSMNERRYNEFEFMKQTMRISFTGGTLQSVINVIREAYPKFPDPLVTPDNIEVGFLEGTRQVYTPRVKPSEPVGNLWDYYMLNGWYNVLSKLAGVQDISMPRIMLYTGGL